MAEVVTLVKCYIKGDERNTEKKAHDVKDRVLGVESSHHPRKNNFTPLVKDKSSFKRVRKAAESFTPLNTH